MGMCLQVLFGVWVLAAISFLSCFRLASSSPYEVAAFNAPSTFPANNNYNPTPTYSRFNEVKEKCGSLLAEASVLPSDPNQRYVIQNELSFVNGDWKQDKGSAPVMPFTNFNNTIAQNLSAISLSSFWITDVDPNTASGKMVNVSGVLKLAISLDRSVSFMGSNPEGFEIYPGFSSLSIRFEGVYLQLKNPQKERLLCMLGSTYLPSRGENSADPWDWLESLSPNLLEDDKILLQLHYPSKLSLTSREIRGKLTSFNRHSNPRYFDGIDIYSQLAAYSNYGFDSGSLVAKACDPYPYADNFQSKGIEIYRGKQLCSTLMQLTSGQILDVVPNWQCNGTNDFCSKLGPFMMDDEVQRTDRKSVV